MRSLILYSLSVATLLNASCGAENSGGSEICPEGATFCTPGQPYDPNTGPTEKEVVAGLGPHEAGIKAEMPGAAGLHLLEGEDCPGRVETLEGAQHILECLVDGDVYARQAIAVVR